MIISEICLTTTKIDMLSNGEPIGSATGFFFRHLNVKYLATNRHVVIDEKKNHFPDMLTLNLHLEKEDLTRNIKIDVTLYENNNSLWKQHPSYETNCCDVILLPLTTNTLKGHNWSHFNSTSIRFIGSDLINQDPVNPCGNVIVVGYPLGFHDNLNNLPIYRNATIASDYGINFQGLPYFLIDSNLHPGTSGSPVVSSHHTLFKEGDGKEGYKLFGIHSAEHIIQKEPLGLNVVWYAENLLKIAES